MSRSETKGENLACHSVSSCSPVLWQQQTDHLAPANQHSLLQASLLLGQNSQPYLTIRLSEVILQYFKSIKGLVYQTRAVFEEGFARGVLQRLTGF